MTKRLLIALFVATLVAPLPSALPLAASADARTPQAPPTPPPAPPETPAKPVPPAPPPAPPARQVEGQPNANVQLDVVVTDTISGKPEGKRVTLLLRNGNSGSLRTTGHVRVDAATEWPVELGLDGRVRILGPGLIEAMVTFNYAAPPDGSGTSGEAAGGQMSPGNRQVFPPSRVTESLTVMLRSGQAMLVSRSADPVTNRTVTVELTATIREP